MANATNDTTNGVWKVSTGKTSALQGKGCTQSVTLNTKDTFVDKNIQVDFTVPPEETAVFGATGSASAAVPASVSTTKDSNGKYPISGSKAISVNASNKVTTGGYAAKDATGSVSISGTATASGTIDPIALKASGSINTATISGVTIGTYNSDNNTYPLTGSATVSGTASAGVSTTGYGVKDRESASTSISGKANLSATVAGATIGVKEGTDDKLTNYTENTTAIVPSGGYLTIDAGYIPATRISLATLVPDDANITSNAVGQATIRQGTSAYDKSGNLVVGTMKDVTPTFAGGAPSVTGLKANVTTPSLKVTKSGTFDTATGYGITSTKPTKDGVTLADGTDYVSIGHTLDFTEGSVTASAQATRAALTYSSDAGYLAAKSGATASSATSSAVSTSAATKIGVSMTDTADTQYIPIVGSKLANAPSGKGGTVTATASATVTQPTVGATYSGTLKEKISTTAPTTGTDGTDFYTLKAAYAVTAGKVTAKADASRAAVTYSNGAGLIEAHTDTALLSAGSATNSKDVAIDAGKPTDVTYYIPKAKLSHGTAAQEKAVSVGVSGARSSNLATPESGDTAYYVTVSGSQTAAGNVKHTASVSAGYTDGITDSEATIATSASISGSGTKVYLKSRVAESGLGCDVTGDGYTKPTLLTTAPTSPYVRFTANNPMLQGEVCSGNSTKQLYMKVFDGSYTVA